MDVEGAEWDALSSTPDSVLDKILQLVVEFHDVRNEDFLGIIQKLKKHFYIVNLHINNFSCATGIEPFPGWAFEALLVNKRIAELDASAPSPRASHSLDAPNTSKLGDCQI